MKEKVLLISSHLLLLGPVVRQVQVIRIGLEEIRHGTGPGSKEYLQLYMKRKYYERDLAYLTMIDSFTQDAPQLLLQSFILLSNHMSSLQHWETSVTQLGSVSLSLLSLSLSLVSYSQASRWADLTMPQLSLLAQLSQWIWRSLILSLTDSSLVMCLDCSAWLPGWRSSACS